MRAARGAMLLGLLVACAGGPAAPRASAEAWPEADALFHQDPRWLGADAAYSIDLGGERVLWLFGDTFVATSPKNVRAESEMVRNTVGVQVGRDPSKATIAFAWGTDPDGSPASFVAEDGTRWHWPLHGTRVGSEAVVFLSILKAAQGQGLGFAADGWRLAYLGAIDEAPASWTITLVDPPVSERTRAFVVGSAVAREGDWLVALATKEGGGHAGSFVRWSAEALAAHDASHPEWLTDAGWVPQGSLTSEPKLVLSDAAPESSVSFDAKRGRWVHVFTRGFGAATLAAHVADRLEGPWSAAGELYRPPEAGRPKPFVYAGKAHPELLGAELVATYAANSFDFGELVKDTSLYYPRFVRVTWR